MINWLKQDGLLRVVLVTVIILAAIGSSTFACYSWDRSRMGERDNAAARYASELNEELSRVELIDSATYPAFSVSGSWRGFSGSTKPAVDFCWSPFGAVVLASQPYHQVSFVEDDGLYVVATFTADSLLGAAFNYRGGMNMNGLNNVMRTIRTDPRCLDDAVSSVEIHGPLHRVMEIVMVIQ